MNKSGKTLTIVLSVLLVFFLCSTAVSYFLYQKEMEKRKTVQTDLDISRNSEMKLQADLTEAKKQMFILEEKFKEADEKINNLMDDLELEQGLKEQIKSENATLKQALETEKSSKDQIREEMAKEVEAALKKAQAVEEQLRTEQARAKTLEEQLAQLQSQNQELQARTAELPPGPAIVPVEPDAPVIEGVTPTVAPKVDENVNLDPIVVSPEKNIEGRILSVDKETEFVIFDLGYKNGIKQGDVMSIVRGDEYLGDVKVSRVQEQMSAADLVPPFSSRMVRKNDQVVPKQ